MSRREATTPETTAARPHLHALLGQGAESDLLRAVLDHTEDGIVACDAAGVLRYFNRATRRMHGLPEEPLPSERWPEHYGLFAADGVTPLRAEDVPLLRALRDGEVKDAEMVIAPRDGEPRHVIASGRAIFGPGGEKVGAVVSMHEISDRKALERERERVRLAQFAAVLSSVSEGVIAADASGNVVDWNAAALAMHDFDDLAQANMHLSRYPDTFELRTPDGEPVPLDAWPLSRVLRGETVSPMELRVRRLDRGWEKALVYSGTPVRGADGEIVLAVLTIHDLTGRKQAEELLARSRAQMEIVVHGANVGIWYCPLPFDRLIWDATVREHFHLPPDAEVAIDTFYERMHPEDRDATRRAIDESIASGERCDIEYRTVSPDGTRIKWIHAVGRALYDAAGDPLRFDGITIDITAKKRAEIEVRDSERRFRVLADAAPAMLWVTEPDGYCSFLSRGWYEFTGQTVEEGLGYGWANAAHPDDRAAAAGAFRDALARRTAYEADFRIRRADGAYRWVIDAGRPRFGPGGELLGFVGSVIDVHERKEAEARLLESEARLRLAIEIVQLGTFDIDLATDAVAVNDTGREIYGWAPDEPLTFAKVQSHFHPDDAEHVNAEVERAMRPDGPGEFDVEQRIVRTDGATRWIRVRGRAVFERSDEGPRATRCVGTYLDITERREAAEREALQRRLVETVIQHLPASVAIIGGRDLRYRLVNPAYLALAAGREVVGRTVDEVWPEQSPELAARCRRVLETGEPHTFVDEPLPALGDRTADAGERFFSASMHRVRLPGEDELGLLVTIWETTARMSAERAARDREERFRQLANSMPQLAWMARPDGWIFWYNDRWFEYTGTTPEQMQGWAWQSVHDPQVLPLVMQRWTASIASGEVFDMTFPLRGADGALRPFLTRVAPLRDAAGNIALWFGTNTDVSDQERLLTERQALLASEQAARARAEEESRLKDEFLATLSHELRTPLNAILGWSQLIRQGTVKGEDALSGMHVIERNARVQAQLVEDLLDMSRIIAGTIRLDVQRVSLADTVAAALETVRPAAEAKGLRLVEVLDPLAGPVSGDPNRLQQIVWNLLHNAVKFTPRGGRVEVRLERVSSHVELSIHDTGEGIRPDFLAHVFDRFRQADGTSTRRHGGLGLGLSIVKQLVELHGGTVGAKSPGEGLGASFIVSLPVAPLRDDAERTAVSRRHPTAPTPALEGLDGVPGLSGVSVLVVDDDADSREMVRRLLEASGAAVACASTAAEALERISQARPDVLVSDIGMPEVDGYELIRRVRQLGPAQGGRTPSIALTAYARSDDRRRAIAAGYQMHLAKPVDGSELVTIIASLAGTLGPARPNGDAARRA
ncbi:MAG: PAS domain S-box protein [Myxococcota bacterium]|nr:PAS domain S-box protein [Myxococcota bacterium]